jgi:DNA-binding response OmpR family regulator
MSHRILIVEDEPSIAELIAVNLTHAGYEVEKALQTDIAHNMMREELPSLLILDWMLPGKSGIQFAKELRANERTRSLPILMLTARSEESDKVLGLDSGADDYVTKPFRIGVLLARVRAQLRQFERSDDATFQIGPYSFRPGGKLLLDPTRNKRIRLTEKETQILKFLFRAGDRAVGRDILLGEVWGYNAAVATHTLETHIYRLRQKIERDPSQAVLLVTEPGGYRLVP